MPAQEPLQDSELIATLVDDQQRDNLEDAVSCLKDAYEIALEIYKHPEECTAEQFASCQELLSAVFHELDNAEAASDTMVQYANMQVCEATKTIDLLKNQIANVSETILLLKAELDEVEERQQTDQTAIAEAREKLCILEQAARDAQDKIRDGKICKYSLLGSSLLCLSLSFVTFGISAVVGLPLLYGALGPAQSHIEAAEAAKQDVDALQKNAQKRMEQRRRECEITQKRKDACAQQLECQIHTLALAEKQVDSEREMLYNAIEHQARTRHSLHEVRHGTASAHVLKTVAPVNLVALDIILMQNLLSKIKEIPSLPIPQLKAIEEMQYNAPEIAPPQQDLPQIVSRLSDTDDEEDNSCELAVSSVDEQALSPHKYERMAEIFQLLLTQIASTGALATACRHSDEEHFEVDVELNQKILLIVHNQWDMFSQIDSQCSELAQAFSAAKMVLAEAAHEVFADFTNHTTVPKQLVSGIQKFPKCIATVHELSCQCLKATEKICMLLQSNSDQLAAFLQEIVQRMSDGTANLQRCEAALDTAILQHALQLDVLSDLRKTAEQINESDMRAAAKVQVNVNALASGKQLALLAATDVGIELGMDIVFTFIPFLKAVEFLDEAMVVSRYIYSKGKVLYPLIKEKLSELSKKLKSGESTTEFNAEAYVYAVDIVSIANRLTDNLIDDDGRLVDQFVDRLMLDDCLVCLQSIASDLNAVRQSDASLQGQIICQMGIDVCNTLLRTDPNLNCTTNEADCIVDSLRRFQQCATEFETEAKNADPENQTRRVRKESEGSFFLSGIIRGFTGTAAKMALMNVQSAADMSFNESQRYEAAYSNARNQRQKVHDKAMRMLTMGQKKQSMKHQLNVLAEMLRMLIQMKEKWCEYLTRFQSVKNHAHQASQKLQHMTDVSSTENVRKYALQQGTEAISFLHGPCSFAEDYMVVSKKFLMPAVDSLGELLKSNYSSDSNELETFEERIVLAQTGIESLLNSNN